MNQQNQQMSNSFTLSEAPLKRKRGRPRKDQSQNPGKSTYAPRKIKDQSLNQNQNRSGSAPVPVPPGFERVNGSQPHSVDTVQNHDNNEDAMLGQVVTGVIEASFDAGFLISVRVGESDTNLRGVVFKPGHYVPISSENDVAPSLRMIRRNEVPFPSSGNQGQGHKRRGRDRSEHHAAVRSQQLSIGAAQAQAQTSPLSPPVAARGTVVPVVLQPVNLTNGGTPAVEAPPVASQPAHLAAASKSKLGPIHDPVPKSSPTDGGFEELVSAAKKMRGSPETQSGKSSNKTLPRDSGLTPEQVQDLSKPLLVKPLQAIRSGVVDQSASMSHAFPERRTGKMTELLLAVQENLMERQMSESQHQDFRSPEN